MLKNAAVGTGIQVIPQSVMGEIQLDIPSIEVQRLVVEMDRLRKEGECIRSEIDILKQSLQDQLLMDSERNSPLICLPLTTSPISSNTTTSPFMALKSLSEIADL